MGTSALGKIKFIEEVDQMTDEEMTDEIFDEMKNYQYFPSLLSGKYELNTQWIIYKVLFLTMGLKNRSCTKFPENLPIELVLDNYFLRYMDGQVFWIFHAIAIILAPFFK